MAVSRTAGRLSRAAAIATRWERTESKPAPGRKSVRRRVLACAVRRGAGTTNGLPAHVPKAINSKRFCARRSSSSEETAITARGSFSIIQCNSRQAAPRRPAAASFASICGGVIPTGGATSAGGCSSGISLLDAVSFVLDEESEGIIIHAPSKVRDYVAGMWIALQRNQWPLVFYLLTNKHNTGMSHKSHA